MIRRLPGEYFSNDYLWSRLIYGGQGGGQTQVILFGTTWCPVCKDLSAGVWPRLKTALPNIKFKEIDCDASKDLCLLYGIKSYPTILILKNGVPKVYRGSWRYEELMVELARLN